MDIVQAKMFYNLSENEMWGFNKQRFLLEFEDGVIETNLQAAIFSCYSSYFHRYFPKLPYLKCHHIGDELVTKKSFGELLNNARDMVMDIYGDSVDREEISRMCFDALNLVYNVFTEKLKPHVSTISALDFVNASTQENILKANSTVKPTQDSIEDTYNKITEALVKMDDNSLRKNTLGRMAKSGLVSMGQIRQCIGPRGYITDIDSNLFRDPVLQSFAGGLNTLEGSMKESRSAAKANKFAENNVSDTEYFSREMQLQNAIVTRIHKGDCGSKKYIKINLTASDFNQFLGKYYLDEDNTLKEIRKKDRHLIGKSLKIRSVIKCEHPDHYGVCQVCYGKLADSHPENTNIGHLASIVVGEKTSQNVLSTKHLDMSTRVDEFILDDFDAKFLVSTTEASRYTSDEITVIKLNPKLKEKHVVITLLADQAVNLTDLDYHDLKEISASTIGKLSEIKMTIYHKEGFDESVTLSVSMASRLSWLTMDFLEYIKNTGYKLDSRGDYTIDLSNWVYTKSLFQLPAKHTDMVQYMRQVKAYVINTGGIKSRNTTPDDFLMAFYNLVNSKLDVNFVHLEVIILSTMVTDLENGDHRLPVPAWEGEISPYRDNMRLRSMGVSMAYQGQGKELISPKSYIKTNRPDSVYDNLLVPNTRINPRD